MTELFGGKTRHQPAALQKSGDKNYEIEEEAKQRWTEKLDLVSCGHALVLTLNIVALFVWDGQHLDVLDCSLISLAGSGGDAGYMGSSILCHLMALAWTPSCLSMGAPGLGPRGGVLVAIFWNLRFCHSSPIGA